MNTKIWVNYHFLWVPVDYCSFEYFGYLKLDKNVAVTVAMTTRSLLHHHYKVLYYEVHYYE